MGMTTQEYLNLAEENEAEAVALLAEHVMGWKVLRGRPFAFVSTFFAQGGDKVELPPGGIEAVRPDGVYLTLPSGWNPLKEANDRDEMLEHLLFKANDWDIWTASQNSGGFRVAIWKGRGGPYFDGEADSFGKAAAVACLKAVGWIEENL